VLAALLAALAELLAAVAELLLAAVVADATAAPLELVAGMGVATAGPVMTVPVLTATIECRYDCAFEYMSLCRSEITEPESV
jgi:hypothetical protein